MNSATEYKLALLKMILDGMDAKIAALGRQEPAVSHALAEMHFDVTQARMVIVEWQDK
jgi:hypothetical protein